MHASVSYGPILILNGKSGRKMFVLAELAAVCKTKQLVAP